MNKEFQKIYDLLNKNGFMDDTYSYESQIDAIYAAHDIDTLITVLDKMDKRCAFVEKVNLIETLDFIRSQYPNKKEDIDFLILKKQVGSHLDLWSIRDVYSPDRIAESSTPDELIEAISKIPSVFHNKTKVTEALEFMAAEYPEYADKISESLSFKSEFDEIYESLNKNGEMEQTYNNRGQIKNILQVENIDALIQVLDYTIYDRVKAWNLIETFDLIKQKYPNKAEIVDSIQIKKNIGSMLYFPYYSAEEEFNKTQSLDDIIKYIQK